MTLIENILDLITQPGIVQVLDQVENIQSYYLAECNQKQYFIQIDNESIVTTELVNNIHSKTFTLGRYIYRKMYQTGK